MASINISELNPAGSGLFHDSESFLNELSDSQTMELVGAGRKKGGGFLAYSNLGISISAQSVNGNTVNANTYGNFNTAYVG
ncbi:hypothetical protein IQ268_23950 [Oculatella sp. LEGE 06141]|uniref:hypothetical protein n=1 Tax=Oculatella sp. LEGE 06141 TaxID=1828648 RepID=UPI0018814C53|nr:hypothetical protein [Oculatella sp. LEGE 06141]MBE9181621.1 hypothetical protein [Oculatella sp. LEGE 06141]